MESNKPLVYYTYKASSQAKELLDPFCEVYEHDESQDLSKNALIMHARKAHAICCRVSDIIDEEIINSCPELKVISLAGRGPDNIDVSAATRRNIWATTAIECVEPTADLAWALLLSVARKITSADSLVRSGRFKGWTHPPPFYGSTVVGKTLGIIGMGHLGIAIARRARGFDMTILYYDTHRYVENLKEEYNMTALPRDELLKRSDFICLASPLNEQTFHQISTRELSLMKSTAYIINPSRGSEVNEQAIAESIDQGRLAGYAADVFEMEDTRFPDRPQYVNQKLIELSDQTIFTPHLGTAVPEFRIEIMKMQALNVLQALRGEKPAGAINCVRPQKPALIG
ncbi:MAG TPA: NAD(P)-dependent oxidoreductase [Deltaproteobacteria bacterium]|nr:NAD(P)-dependent oxidoreductase [Deltaproteobacteria bacterium]HPJ93950.1 NAD(P)-dependent oxidoreductase [Deltaproteobacteria bacterium]HPR51337.1 NAD(P)-dependent oxidoreductase [Deltaproteobacteria bacterium]